MNTRLRLRTVLALLTFFMLTANVAAQEAAPDAVPDFGFENVAAKARELAASPFKSLSGQVPKSLMEPELSYDQWRDIRFKPAHSLWRNDNLPFEVQFFHVGLYYDLPVTINMVDGQGVSRVDYNSDLFDYGQNTDLAKTLPKDLGFAGFRLHYPLKSSEYKDEVAVFLGASYFKGIGKNHYYGLSARGLAIDTASKRPEEFPYFREFWLVKPAKDATAITVYALMDSPSTAGAYEFQIIPGEETIMEIRSQIIQRHGVTTLGVAPLTSMFFYGENYNCHRDDDFRPEVHDSDGLSLASGTGEWLWRPLQAPVDRVITNAFGVEHLVGFGLMQRDTNFDHYQDLEAHYQGRPSAFVTPKGDWGPGEVRLIQIPSPSEIHDNMVAFWSPKNAVAPGTPMNFDYSLAWTTASPKTPPTGQVVATRRARGSAEGLVKIVIDFEGEELAALPASAEVKADVSMDEGAEVVEAVTQKNDVTGGWRLIFQVKPKDGGGLMDNLLGGGHKPLTEMRAFLSLDGRVLTETWTYGLDM